MVKSTKSFPNGKTLTALTPKGDSIKGGKRRVDMTIGYIAELKLPS